MGTSPSTRGINPQQAVFDFLLPVEHPSLNVSHEQVANPTEVIKGHRLPKPGPLVCGDLFEQIPLDLLSDPLISLPDIPGVLPKFASDIGEDHGDVLSAHVDEDESNAVRQEWSDQAVAELHEGLLFSSLASLAAKSNETEKVETLKWFFLPDIHSWKKSTGPNGKPVFKPVYANQIPFTFQRCCAYMGYNPQHLRDGLLSTLQKAGLGHYVP